MQRFNGPEHQRLKIQNIHPEISILNFWRLKNPNIYISKYLKNSKIQNSIIQRSKKMQRFKDPKYQSTKDPKDSKIQVSNNQKSKHLNIQIFEPFKDSKIQSTKEDPKNSKTWRFKDAGIQRFKDPEHQTQYHNTDLVCILLRLYKSL